MVVQFEQWDRTKNYDRTGLETQYYDILGVQVPSMLIPVMPGRNLAVILETAAINNRTKEMGYNAAKELLAQLACRMTFRYKYTEKRDPHPMQMIADLHTAHAVRQPRLPDVTGDGRRRQNRRLLRNWPSPTIAPAMPDAPHSWHFSNGSSLPRQIDGVVMLYRRRGQRYGHQGRAGYAAKPAGCAGLGGGSIHSPCVPGLLTRKEANRLWLQEAENPYVDCIGHSEQENYRYDYDLVTKAFARSHKVVELNANSFNVRRDGIPNMRELLRACLQNGCRIAVNSDAHSAWKLQTALPPLYALAGGNAFPQELIVNATRQNLVQELKLHGRRCAEEVGGIIL